MYYRRNADTQLRTALRQFEAGQVPPGYVARILERTGTAIEILNTHETTKTINVHFNLEVGTPDSLLGPWGLDEQLLAITNTALNRFYPNLDDYDGDFRPVESEQIFRACPELEEVLGGLSPLASFLVSYRDQPLSDDLRPELTMTVDLAQRTYWQNRRETVMARYQALYSLFGMTPVVIYAQGAAIVEHEPLGPKVERIISEEELEFNGWVSLPTPYLGIIQLYPRFTVLGRSIEDWKDHIRSVIRHSSEVPDYFREPPTQCIFEGEPGEVRGPIVGICLGLAIKIPAKGGQNPLALHVGSTTSLGASDVKTPSELLTWFWVFREDSVDPLGDIPYDGIGGGFQVYMVQGSDLLIITEDAEVDYRNTHPGAPLATTRHEYIRYLKVMILRAARNQDATIEQIVWLD